jgi:hypothetical protein
MCQSVGVLVEGLRPLTGSIVAVILGIFGKSASGPFAWGCALAVVILAAVSAMVLIRMADEWLRAHTRGRVRSGRS